MLPVVCELLAGLHRETWKNRELQQLEAVSNMIDLSDDFEGADKLFLTW